MLFRSHFNSIVGLPGSKNVRFTSPSLAPRFARLTVSPIRNPLPPARTVIDITPDSPPPVGAPEEVAAGVAFFASSVVSYCQGAIIDVDGGKTRTL